MTVAAAKRGPGRPRSAKHGTRSKYARGCHCPDCTQANRDYQRSWYRSAYRAPGFYLEVARELYRRRDEA